MESGDRLFVRLIPPPSEFEEWKSVRIRAAGTPSTRLAEEAAKDKPKLSFEAMVPSEYRDYADVFSKESFDELPDQKPWDHAIELNTEAIPKTAPKVYPLSLKEQQELDAFLQENLASGRIRPSKSPLASPVFFVKKKDGSLRFVQDYRKLNSLTIKNRYPLPLMADIITKLRNAKFYTKLDVRWGYNNIRIKEGDEWKAAFRTNRGMYEPLVMFFGLTNSPATFQTMMNDIFRDLIDEGVVIVYMDDILIFTETRDKHRDVTRRVLEILRQQKLYLKPEKCEFSRERIEYLGLIISADGVAMDPIKVQGVTEWPAPKNLKEVQSFVGFINFYRRFINGFSEMARPLHDLTAKGTPWQWGDAQAKAFRDLKAAITSAPILVFLSESKVYHVECDSSDYATGAVLSQEGSDGKLHPIAFLSKSLNAVERNYEIHDKEMLSVMRALEEWRHYLEGTETPFEIYNDHKNLEYFMGARKLNRRQARWYITLSDFNFQLKYRPGKQNGKADALSRRPDHGDGKDDNEGVVLLKPEWFRTRAIKRGHVILAGSEVDILKDIRKAKEMDKAVAKAMEALRTNPNQLRRDDWAEEQGLILFRGRVYVPMDPDLRRRIVESHHDTPLAGHPGKWKTQELVSRNYWWPGIGRYIAEYVKGCDKCNRTKTFPTKPAGKLMPNRIPTRKWEVVTCDLITNLPESQGFDSIFVAVDRLSKRARFAPTKTTVDSPGIARLFLDNVFKNHGLPDEVISDRGPQFVSEFMRELHITLGIKTSASTAYHPQTDGQTERVNQELEQYLRLFTNFRQDDWSSWLSVAEFSYNNRIHSSTRQTPFMIDMGRHPRMGVEPTRSSAPESVAEYAKRLSEIEEEARAALVQAADDMARFYDAHHGPTPVFAIGQKVWLDSKNITTTRPTKKMDDKWFGPFKVSEKINDNAYRLALPPQFKGIHPVFNVVKLREWTKDTIQGRKHPEVAPPPILVNDEPEWEVEEVVDSKLVNGKLWYRVKYQGYRTPEWQPAEDLEHSQEMVLEFHRRKPNAPRYVSRAEFEQLDFQPVLRFTEIDPDYLLSEDELWDWSHGQLASFLRYMDSS